jgi:hypothetical protein
MVLSSSAAVPPPSLVSSASSSSLTSPFDLFDFSSLPPSSAAYVREFCSYSLDRLEREPELINQQTLALESEIHQLAVSNARLFVASHDFIQESSEALNQFDQRISFLQSELPSLARSIENFHSVSSSLRSAQRRNKYLIDHHQSLYEYLELPALMESCVQQQLIEEALDLLQFTRELTIKHSSIPFFTLLYQQMNQTKQSIIKQLISHLSQNSSLSHCIRLISYLKRLNEFNELKLKKIFLLCKTTSFTSLINQILVQGGNTGNNTSHQLGSVKYAQLSSSVSLEYCNKYLDLHRVQLLEIITQYKAIFSEDGKNQQNSNQENHDRGLLARWCHQRIDLLLSTISSILVKLDDGAALHHVLDQAMYCGLFLSRVGLDFRPALVTIFSKAALHLFDRQIRSVIPAFEDSLDSFDWFIHPSHLQRLMLPHERNPELLQCPPLAIAANSFINAANSLRQCAPIAIQPEVCAVSEGILSQMVTALKTRALPVALSTPSIGPSSASSSSTSLTPIEQRQKLALVMDQHFFPFVQQLIHSIFSQSTSGNSSVVQPAIRLEKASAGLNSLIETHQTGAKSQEIVHINTTNVQPVDEGSQQANSDS